MCYTVHSQKHEELKGLLWYHVFYSIHSPGLRWLSAPLQDLSVLYVKLAKVKLPIFNAFKKRSVWLKKKKKKEQTLV